MIGRLYMRPVGTSILPDPSSTSRPVFGVRLVVEAQLRLRDALQVGVGAELVVPGDLVELHVGGGEPELVARGVGEHDPRLAAERAVEQVAGESRNWSVVGRYRPGRAGSATCSSAFTCSWAAVTGMRETTARSSQTLPRTAPMCVPSYARGTATEPNTSSHATPVSSDAPKSFSSASQYMIGSGREEPSPRAPLPEGRGTEYARDSPLSLRGGARGEAWRSSLAGGVRTTRCFTRSSAPPLSCNSSRAESELAGQCLLERRVRDERLHLDPAEVRPDHAVRVEADFARR